MVSLTGGVSLTDSHPSRRRCAKSADHRDACLPIGGDGGYTSTVRTNLAAAVGCSKNSDSAAAGGEEILPRIHEAILRIEAGERPIHEARLRIEAGGDRTLILNTQLLTVSVQPGRVMVTPGYSETPKVRTPLPTDTSHHVPTSLRL